MHAHNSHALSLPRCHSDSEIPNWNRRRPSRGPYRNGHAYVASNRGPSADVATPKPAAARVLRKKSATLLLPDDAVHVPAVAKANSRRFRVTALAKADPGGGALAMRVAV